LNEDSLAVLHFSGHGASDQGLCFQSDDGSIIGVSAEGLAQVIRAAGGSVAIVIESMIGETIAAGEVTLQPGIYRLPARATLIAQSAARGTGYRTTLLGDSKRGLPDPPLQAVQQYGVDQIQNFLGAAGTEEEKKKWEKK
jgi:hypothetical protein